MLRFGGRTVLLKESGKTLTLIQHRTINLGKIPVVVLVYRVKKTI